jgi:alkylation response protein AidB-like acyl-CoA dehydrogenase
VSLETHHAFGAIGYAEEHEAPRHFRRVHLDTLPLGGAARARAELAPACWTPTARTLPEYDLGPAGNAFRHRGARLAAGRTLERRAQGRLRPPALPRPRVRPVVRAGHGPHRLDRPGVAGAHGGQARSPREQLGFMEVMERAEAPRFGASVQANALMMHGTAEQQARYLPEILRGEAMHGMGYSEPDAGSDLASLRTRAGA